jgi:anti-anti-sigma regulatory factor
VLKITFQQSEEALAITLEGRLAGPWAEELVRAWREKAPSLTGHKVSIDLRNTTYADAIGMQALRDIYAQTRADIVTGTPWTQYLALEVTHGNDQLV